MVLAMILDFIIRTFKLFRAFSKMNRSFDTAAAIDQYNDLHEKKELNDRNSKYMELVNYYYDLSTAFYEWGWGSSFHFHTRKKYEDFRSATLRHEAYLAHRLRLNPGDKVLDVGCGIGGPLRNIAQITGAHITGLNNNAYQIERGNEENKAIGLDKTCGFIKNDFCKMTLPNNTFDAVYAIEATCHAPRRQDVYGEIYRVLKPGGCFAAYEWCLTDKYNPKSAEHQKIKKWIEIGDGLPDIATTHEVDQALKDVGFEILETRDLMAEIYPDEVPWYDPLVGRYFPPRKLQVTKWGGYIANKALGFLEMIRIAPPGAVKVSNMLLTGAHGLVLGGQTGTFTPAYFILAQKKK